MKCDGFLQILLRNKLKHDDTRISTMMLMPVVEIIYIMIKIMIMMTTMIWWNDDNGGLWIKNQVDCEGEDQRESREEREMVLTTVQLRRASIMDTLVPQVRMTTMVVSLVCKGLVKSGLFVLSTIIIMISRGRRGGGKVASPAVGARGGAVGSTGFSIMVMVIYI